MTIANRTKSGTYFNKLLELSLVAVAFPAAASEPQAQLPSTQSGASAATSVDLNALRQQGITAYQEGKYADALRIFSQVIAADPSDVVANNISGNSSLRLEDYPAAIVFFKRALQLRPDEYHNLSGLIRAYTLAGMAPERDDLRKHIEGLANEGKLPDTFHYVFETFETGDKKVEVAEFPKIQGFYGERYRFIVFNSGGQEIFCVTLESDALEQPSWAKQHPTEAAAGGRKFSLDGYSRESHWTYGFYDGEPSYESVREEAKQVLAGKKKIISKTDFPSPQPIPGEN